MPQTTEHGEFHLPQQQVLFTSSFLTFEANDGDRQSLIECQPKYAVPLHNGTGPFSVQGSDRNGITHPTAQHKDQADVQGVRSIYQQSSKWLPQDLHQPQNQKSVGPTRADRQAVTR